MGSIKTKLFSFVILACIIVFAAVSGCVNKQVPDVKVKRYGWVIKVKPEKLEEYKKLHANVWPEVNKIIKESNIRNYTIFYRDGLLFSYLEYTGTDFKADMKKMADNPVTQKWWKLTDPCQEPVESAGEGVWWADMEEVYHLD